MHQWKAENGSYRAEVTVYERRHISVGVLCEAAATVGHYVALTPEQAVNLCQFLCDHVPGLAESLKVEV